VISSAPSTEDLVALRLLVDSYADAMDRRDASALISLFTEAAVLRMQADEGPIESEWVGSRITESLDALSAFHHTFHLVGGAVFEYGPDADHAAGRVHCLAHHYQRTPNGPVDLVMMIRYHDRYERSTSWRIADRRVAIEWTELHPAHPPRRRAPQ
jgi:hypothetical protein